MHTTLDAIPPVKLVDLVKVDPALRDYIASLGEVVLIGLQRGDDAWAFPVEKALMTNRETGAVLLAGVMHLLDGVPDTVRMTDRFALCFLRQSPLYGEMSAEVDITPERIFLQKWPDIAMNAALIACRAAVDVEHLARRRRRLDLDWLYAQRPFRPGKV